MGVWQVYDKANDKVIGSCEAKADAEHLLLMATYFEVKAKGATGLPFKLRFHEEPEPDHAYDLLHYTVAIYREHQRYGGPEEGGWYWDEGYLCDEPDLLRHRGAFESETDAWDYAKTLYPIVDAMNAKLPPYTSTRSQGRYAVHVEEVWLEVPTYYPEHRPHYE